MNDHTPTHVNPAYIGDFNRVLKGMTSRTSRTGAKPGVNEVTNQIAIRAFTLNISSARREVTAARAVCRAFLEDGAWPEGVVALPPVSHMNLEEVGQILDFACLPVSELIGIGQELVEEITETLMRSGYSGSGEDLAQMISGVFPNRARGKSPSRKTHIPVTEGDLSRIDFHMMDQPHEEAVRTFAGPRRNVIALTRVFLRVIWLTGMRPIEVFGCRLMAGDPSRDYTYAQLGLIRKNPEQAAMTGLLTPQEALPGAEEIGHSRAVMESVKSTGVDPILLVKNAKTRNANAALVRPYRVQVLSGIGEEDLHLISLAALLHRTPLEKERARDLINMVTRRIRAIANEEFPDRANPINLYALRHDFATRARRRMPLHQVAALMGHTAYGSTRGYGKAQTRQSRSGSGGGGWAPTCDETVALRLRDAFGMAAGTPEPEQGPTHENE
jgi:hypothetical protein